MIDYREIKDKEFENIQENEELLNEQEKHLTVYRLAHKLNDHIIDTDICIDCETINDCVIKTVNRAKERQKQTGWGGE